MRVLHISDLHILASPDDKLLGINTTHSLETVLSDAFNQSPMPEWVLVTGDLSEDGSKSAYLKLREILTDLGVPVSVLPGNHDSVDQINSSLLCKTITMEFLKFISGWAVVSLNTQVKGQSFGTVKETELHRLATALEAYPHFPFLIALHHTLESPCNDPDCNLTNGNELLTLADKHENIRVIVGGHVHADTERRVGGLSLITTPSTCLQCEHPDDHAFALSSDPGSYHKWSGTRHGYRIFDLQSGGQFATQIHWIKNPDLLAGQRS